VAEPARRAAKGVAVGGSGDDVEYGRELRVADAPCCRIVLLNHLVSLSIARTKSEQRPPTEPGYELLKMIFARWNKGTAIEYLAEESDADDIARIEKNSGQKSYTRIQHMLMPPAEPGDHRYVAILLEYLDINRHSFHVSNPKTFQGRPIKGEETERGVISAVIMIRLPAEGAYDDGRYRCVVEAMPSLNRAAIEHFLCRQLRRDSDRDKWTYPVDKPQRKGTKKVPARYTPKLELHAGGFGRKVDGSGGTSKILKSLTFVKRASKESIGEGTDIEHTEFEADLRVHVSAAQGVSEPGGVMAWAKRLRKSFEERGYETSVAFRHAGGDVVTGKIDASLSSAADLMLCQREPVTFATPREIWEATLRPDVVDCLREVLDRDELWERPEQG
jgi:hypothetical protein